MKPVAAILLLLTALAVAADEAPKPTTVREMIAACPEAERGPENGKDWKKLHYDRIAAWFRTAWEGKQAIVTGTIKEVKSGKDGKAVATIVFAPDAKPIFGHKMSGGGAGVSIERADESPFVNAKPGASVTVVFTTTKAYLFSDAGKKTFSVSLDGKQGKIIPPAKPSASASRKD